LIDDPIAIRDLLVAQLRQAGQNGRLVPEMGLCQGRARIDLAAIGVGLEGYEIKSGRDDLRRLSAQAVIYGQVFDRVTLVAPERHLVAASGQVPDWWGLSVVNADARRIEPLREPSENPARDALSTARLLWRDEVAAALEERLGQSPRAPRPVLWRQLADIAPPEELRALVCRCLRARTEWRAAG
jgi:hypothetical protein